MLEPQEATAGQPIAPPVRVSARDSAGRPLDSYNGVVTITLASGPSGATLTGETAAPVVDGVAVFSNLRIDKPGSGYALRASTPDLGDVTSAAFNVAAPTSPPPAATKLRFSQQPTTTQVAQPITPAVSVSALDGSGNVVTGFNGTITVMIGTNPGGGTLSGTRARNAVSGVATFSGLGVDRAGSGYTLVAMASGLASATSAAFNVTAAAPPPPPPATHLGFTQQPSDAQAGTPITPAVKVAALDASGNVVSDFTADITVAIAANPGGGTLSGTKTAAAVNGVATFPALRIDQAGSGYTLTAAASGLTAATSSAFTITSPPPPPPPPATHLAFTRQPGDAQAGSTIAPVKVSALDASGNVVTGFSSVISVAIGSNPGGGTLTGSKAVNAVSGVATFSSLGIDQAGAGYTLVASAAGLAGATSTTFDITAPAATRLAFAQQPGTTPAGNTMSPAVTVAALDDAGNVVSGYGGPITVALGANPGGGTLSGTTTRNATSGIATFSGLSIDKAGSGYTLGATSGTLSGATSASFAIIPGPATQLVFTVQPSNALPLTTIRPPVQVTAFDSFGNQATGFSGTVKIAIGHDASLLGNATLSGSRQVTASAGVALFADLSIDQVGLGYTLVTSFANGASPAQSTAFNILIP